MKPDFSKKSGSALVTTLLVIVVLTIIVTAFLQSMTTERQTAGSYINRYQAQLAADAGTDYAKNLIFSTISGSADKKVNFATWAYSPDAATFAPFFTGILPNSMPLSTGSGTGAGFDSVTSTVWLVSDPANSSNGLSDPTRVRALPVNQRLNINFRLPVSMNGTPRYWLDQTGTTYPAGWVDLTPQLPAGQAGPNLKIRYAFWVDDEMARADLGVLGNTNPVVRKGTNYKASPEDLVLHTGQDATNSIALSTGAMSTLANTDNRKIAKLTPQSVNQFVDQAGRDLLKNSSLAYTSTNTDLLEKPEPDVVDVFDLIPYGPLAGRPKINLNDAYTTATSTAPDQPARFVWNLVDTLESPDPSYADFQSRPDTPSVRTALPEYFDRKNSPPGNMLRIAASIRDYLSPNTYPTVAPALENYLKPIISQAYELWQSDYQSMDPSFATIDWGNIPLNQRWYGIKGGPFVNAIQMNNTFSGTSCTFNTTFYLWNPSDRTISLSNMYMLVFNYPFRPATFTRNGKAMQGLPYFRGDVFPINNGGSFSLTARQQLAVTLSRNYSGAPNGSGSPSATKFGFILFSRDNSGTIRIYDAYRVYSGKTYSASGGIPGGGQTGSSNVWDTKDRRQNMALLQSEWSTAASATSGNLAGYQELQRWYDRPVGVASTSTDPVMHIASGTMRSLGELGNIFDPVNDTPTSSNDSYTRPMPAPTAGSMQSRGGKTLNVGQFDEFFDKLSTSAPINPMQAKSGGWGSYEKYLRFADTALFDIFTIKTTPSNAAGIAANLPNSQDSRPFNVNSSRPGATINGNLSPLTTYLGAMNSALGTGALNYGTGGGADGMPSNLTTADKFVAAVRERLTHASDWTQCRPFRNYSDLMLLGMNKTSLNNVQGNKAQSMFYSTATNKYLTSPGSMQVTLGSSQYNVLSSRNAQRQAPFARLAEQTTFRSYRYRIYAVGQVYREGQENKPLATVYQTYRYDLNPVYDATTSTVQLHPKLQKIEEN